MNIVEQAHREGHVLIRDYDWEAYEALFRDPGIWHVRVTYDRGTLEVQAPPSITSAATARSGS